ncbi:hypothetical protein C8Q80DRAFT_1209255 [Daedaleopsis nitida]|nr:hypothetical protein C8Q80DRAFT_1209255 [Daedaleopsis nitida]
MKFFSSLLAVTGVALGTTGTMGFPSPRAAQTSPATVINELQTFATQSSTLQASVEQLNALNFLFQGQIISQGINNITDSVGAFTENISGPPFNDAGAQQTISALAGFVNANSFLMSTVIEKHSLAASFLATGPISDALLRWASIWDSLAFPLVGLMPTEEDAANSQVNALRVTIAQANDVYSQ